MKVFIGVLIGVVVGFALGGMGPRRELLAAKDELAAAADRAAKAEKVAARRTSLPGFQRLVSGESKENSTPAPQPPRMRADKVEGDVVPEVPPSAPATREEQRREFELAVEAQRVRARQSREALKQQAHLDEAQMTAVDDIVADMNARLADHGEEVLDYMLSGEEPAPSEVLRITHDVTGVLYDAQADLEDTVGTEGLEATDADATLVWNYVDLGQFREPLEAMLDAQNAPAPVEEQP